MATDSYKIVCKGTSGDGTGTSYSKTFNDVSSECTIAFGTEFANKFFDLTTANRKTVELVKTTSERIDGV